MNCVVSAAMWAETEKRDRVVEIWDRSARRCAETEATPWIQYSAETAEVVMSFKFWMTKSAFRCVFACTGQQYACSLSSSKTTNVTVLNRNWQLFKASPSAAAPLSCSAYLSRRRCLVVLVVTKWFCVYSAETVRSTHGYLGTLIGTWYQRFGIPNDLDLGWPLRCHFKVTKVKIVHNG